MTMVEAMGMVIIKNRAITVTLVIVRLVTVKAMAEVRTVKAQSLNDLNKPNSVFGFLFTGHKQ